MKKIVCFSLLLAVLLGCLTACNFTQNITGALASDAEANAKVEEMVEALAQERESDAKALMHPGVAENAATGIAQMSKYLAGRTAKSMEVKNVNINTSTGTSGKVRQEQLVYQVTLSDDETVYLSVAYLSNSAGSGFTSFQLVLGAV